MLMSTSYSTIILVVHLAILCGVHGQHTYWIAPNTSQCRGRTPCQTLDSYVRDKPSPFSTSHTRWIFLQGQHYLDRTFYIEHATNITLTGEFPCSSTRSEQCSSVLPNVTLWPLSVYIYNITELAITNLRFLSSTRSHDWVSEGFPFKVGIGTLHIDHVHNLTIQAVTVLDVKFEITQPKESVSISQLTTDHFSLNVNLSEAMPHSAKYEIQQPWVSVTVFDSTFKLGPDFEYNITIGENREGIHGVGRPQCHNSSSAVTVYFSHCLFKDSASSLALHFMTTRQCGKVVISDCVFINNRGEVVLLELYGPHQLHVENTHFVENYADYIISAKYLANFQETIEEVSSTPSIIIDNCTFANNNILFSVIDIEHHSRRIKPEGHHDIALHMAFYGHNIFSNNRPYRRRQGLDMIITMTNVMVGVSGMMEIEHNEIDIAAMVLSPNSIILLHNNSQLRIAGNGNFSTTIQFLIDYPDHTYQQYVELSEFDISEGRCIFQFVDDNGMYISEDDLEYFNASIVLSNEGPEGKASGDTQPHYLIYNANLQNCKLTLREGKKTLEEDEKKRFLNLDSWDKTTIGSPAYHACTCDITQPEDRNLWDCSSGTTTTAVYSGLLVRVGLVALGDYGFVQGAKFIILSSPESNQDYSLRYNRGCKELSSFIANIPGENYTVKANVYSQLRIRLDHDDPTAEMVFSKTVIVQVSTNCPTGFHLSSSNNGTTCDCNQLLSNHHFQCIITAKGIRTKITYKSSTNNYWVGYLGQQLVFSDHCLSHYCNTVNSTISTTGLTTEDINTTIQCDPNSNRQGLLCSQCTPGTSSQFGSFRCTQCTFAGLLLVPFGAVAGIVLILLLFLFNFTVLQGDIIGIAFYANVVGIMDEFLQQYSIRIFYIPLALINLGLGFETCFFDGMDEFSKAIVQFVFPFYLIALLIIIIIAAHKYNLKVFRIRFVARRSVPVLATIMLLTYSGLINAVIYGLQYTHIYNVDSGTYQVVWLHQPELEYFKGKHIAVGVLCLVVTLFYLLPLTVVTLLGDLFRICSRNLWYSHFLDVFHGAFRYPFGFWFGTRLLLRIAFITLNITTNTPVVAFTIFLITGSIILLQLVMEPFRTDNVTIYRPDPERKTTRREFVKIKISKIFRPKVIDGLYLLNIMFIATAVTVSIDISTVYTTVGVCLSISLALAQLIAVTVYHTYHYFPLPDSTPQRVESLRERFFKFRKRMRRKEELEGITDRENDED